MSLAASPPTMLPNYAPPATSAGSTPRLPPPSSFHGQQYQQHQHHHNAQVHSPPAKAPSAGSPVLASQRTVSTASTSHSASTPPPTSPANSTHSSPYVSPRLHHRGASDPASASAPLPYTQLPPIMRRGAVSGASGPLSFPPLPSIRHNSAGPGEGIPPGSGSELHYSTWNGGASGSGSGSGSGRLGSFSAASGPHFPLPSSYSLSSGVSSPISHAHGTASPSGANGLNTQRRGGLSASSGVGVYGAASGASSPPHAYTLQPLQHQDQSSQYPSVLGSPYGHHQQQHQHQHHNGHAHPHPLSQQQHMQHAHPMHSYWAPMTGSGLRRKQTSANPPPRNYACPNCPASFSRRHDLNRHSRIHLAVKPFGCPNCAKTFSRKDALKRHLMVKGCGKDAEGRPRKRRGRKSAAEKAAMQREQQEREQQAAAGVGGSQPSTSTSAQGDNGAPWNKFAALPFDYNQQHQYQQYGGNVSQPGSDGDDDEDEDLEDEDLEGDGDGGDDEDDEEDEGVSEE